MTDVVLIRLEWTQGRPRLRVRRPPSAASALVDLTGFALNYCVDGETTRRCLGHKPFRDRSQTWVDCDNEPLHEGRLCDRCAASDATFASQLHHAHSKAPGELDGAVRRHLEQPNKLYLAAFRDGSVKVGTSTANRLEERLDEQGAWIARVVVDATDGYAVRALEDRISAELGLPQSVSIRRKLDGLLKPRPESVLESEIDLWTGRVHDLVMRAGEARLSPVSDDWRFAHADDPVYSGLHPYPLKLDSGAHDFGLLAASGRAVVMERPTTGDRFVADIRVLFGLELALGGFEPDPLAIQDSLF